MLIKTPIKKTTSGQVQLKSPSLLGNSKPAVQPLQIPQPVTSPPPQNKDTNDDDLDFSFEFREAFKKSSSNSKLFENQTAEKKSQKKFTRKGSEKGSLLLTDSKTNTQTVKNGGKDSTQQRDSKRFKQITMTQAMAFLNDSTASSSYKQQTPSLGNKSAANKSSLYRVNVKDEPITLVNTQTG